MKTKAAILIQTGHPLIIEDIDIPDLKAGQVLVRVHFTCLCQTQVSECLGHRGPDHYLPHCLGHEGSGMVEAVGSNVTKVIPGDFVVMSWIKGHGENEVSTHYKWNDKIVNAGAVTTFSTYAVVSENRLWKLPPDADLKKAALLGCAMPTGFGSVQHIAQPKPGQSMAIFGVGGVGFFSLLAAKYYQCDPIIAIDQYDQKLDLAQQIGATHTINVTQNDIQDRMMKILPNGLDYAIDTTGNPDSMSVAFDAIHTHGLCIVVGNPPFGSMLQIDPMSLIYGKRIVGSNGGQVNPDDSFQFYYDLLASSLVDMELICPRVYTIDEINHAIADMREGVVLRPMIML